MKFNILLITAAAVLCLGGGMVAMASPQFSLLDAIRGFFRRPLNAIVGGSGGGNGNGGIRGNTNNNGLHVWQSRNYLLSWRQGQSSLTHAAARNYCRSQGMRIISLDSNAKATHFLDLLERESAPYFWSGGRISSDKRTLSW